MSVTKSNCGGILLMLAVCFFDIAKQGTLHELFMQLYSNSCSGEWPRYCPKKCPE